MTTRIQISRRHIASVRYFNDEDKVGYSEEYSYDEHSRVAQIRTPAGITSYQWGALEWLNNEPRLTGTVYKESYSETQPFNRTKVKLKKELFSFSTLEKVSRRRRSARAGSLYSETSRN